MQGHVARKRGRYYAVIYEGLDPVTGKERRSWHPAGTTEPRPKPSPLGSRPSAMAVTTRFDHSPSAPTSRATGCPPRS